VIGFDGRRDAVCGADGDVAFGRAGAEAGAVGALAAGPAAAARNAAVS
jgi:hypothetical protein